MGKQREVRIEILYSLYMREQIYRYRDRELTVLLGRPQVGEVKLNGRIRSLARGISFSSDTMCPIKSNLTCGSGLTVKETP